VVTCKGRIFHRGGFVTYRALDEFRLRASANSSQLGVLTALPAQDTPPPALDRPANENGQI
jgi:hypothetical protein